MVCNARKAFICGVLLTLRCIFADAVRGDAVSMHKGRFGHKSPDYEVVYPRRVNSKGRHVPFRIPRYFRLFNGKNEESVAKRSIGDVHYKITINGNEEHIEMVPNVDLVRPSMVVESSGGDKIRRYGSKNCYYKGIVRGHKNSKAALSNCDGLAGYIKTNDGYYMIEPLSGSNASSEDLPPHILYKEETKVFLPSEEIPGPNIDLRKKSANDTEVVSRKPVAELNIEVMIVLDHSMLEYHKDIEVENFVLTVFNIVHNLFHDSSLGTNINVAIVRMIRLETDDHELVLASNKNPEKTLEYFRKWQSRMNPKDDSHPNHHDIAILITKMDICIDDKLCGFLGASRRSGMCDPENSAIICVDTGLWMAFTLAHELGHALGLEHDPITDIITLGVSVMAPYISLQMNTWSNCSSAMLKQYLNLGFASCLYDTPTDHSFVLIDTEPGVMYDADYQCKEIFGPNAALCMTGVECENLICYIEDKGCVESHMRPAEGTNCGENKWCFRGECVEVGERPRAVDGGWGPWSEWSECSRTCGSGVSWQERHCNNPQPSMGGKFCSGEDKRHRICSTEPCEIGEPSFRDLQCSEFNMWLYPEDGKMHQWKSYSIHDENPCVLFCVNDQGDIAALRPRVIDGTTCYRGIRDICINGLCKEIPCDLDLESNAVEDRCGVCKGDGTSCDIVRDQKTFPCTKSLTGEKKFIEIPRGAMNIKIEELLPSESHVEIRDKDGRNTFIAGDSLGVSNVFGTKAWVGMIRTKQEAISIPGPLSQTVSVWVVVVQNTTVKFSYGTKAKTNRTSSFTWDYLDWSKCSTECGPGTQEARPRCVEKEAGYVDEMYCKNITRPKEQVRPCEEAPCTPRWFIGDWQPCSRCPWGTKWRLVKCFRPVGTGEGELDIIMDAYCAPPKPHAMESCNCNREKSNDKIASNKTETDLKKVLPPIKTELDFMRPENIILTVHTELESSKYPEGLPHPKNANSSMYTETGIDALKFMNKMEQNFANNKTRIR